MEKVVAFALCFGCIPHIFVNIVEYSSSMHPENLHTVIRGSKIEVGSMPVQTYPICPEPIQF